MRLDGQGDRERAALPRFALEPDVPAVEPCEAARQCQAQTGARLGAPDSRVNLLELVEDALLVLFVNADAGVGERNLDRVRKATRLDRDHAALGSELDGVGREVEQHLLHLAGVCGDLSRGSIDDLELNLLLRG